MSDPDISIVVPTLDPDVEFGWKTDLEESAVEGEVLLMTEGSASAARNAGIRKSSADKVVFLDDDSVPQGEYFERVSALLDEHPAVTGRVVDSGATLTRILSTHYDKGDTGHRTEMAVGCNMAIRRGVLDDVGYFDERLPHGHEETELLDRVNESYYIWYSPDLVVEHPFAHSVLDYFEKSYRHGHEAITYYVVRRRDVHEELRSAIFSPSRYLKPSVLGTVLSATGQILTIAGLLKGYVEFRFGEHEVADRR